MNIICDFFLIAEHVEKMHCYSTQTTFILRCNCFSGWRGDDCSERTCTRLCLPQQQNCKIERYLNYCL